MMKSPDLNPDAPWKSRYPLPVIEWAQIATRNPQRGLICSNKDGNYQLYAWDVPTGKLAQRTFQRDGVTIGSISADGERIYYLKDSQGPGIGHYFSLSFDGTASSDITPDLPVYSSHLFTESHTGNHFGFLSVNQYGYRIFAVHKASGGTPSLHINSEQLIVGPIFSHDGEMTVLASSEHSPGTDFHLEAYDTNSGQKIREVWDGAGTNIQASLFSPLAGDTRLLASSNRTGEYRPFIWNPFTGVRLDLDMGETVGDIMPWGWSADGTRVLLYQVTKGDYQLYSYDIDAGQAIKLNHPPGTYSDGNFTADGSIYAVWEDAVHPKRLIELDGSTGEKIRDVLVLSEDVPGRAWQSITFEADDGTMVQGWLATPDGDAPYPLLLDIHGGPNAVTTNSFQTGTQAWLDHGVAVCHINYRGSTSFGGAFEAAVNGEPGRYEVADIAAGARWLIGQGIAQDNQIIVSGRSYGGFLALMALSQHAELFAAGIADSPIADWATLYESLPDTLKAYQRQLFGNQTDGLTEAQQAASPITYAENLNAPLLILHPAKDERIASAQMQGYLDRLESLGKAYNLHTYDMESVTASDTQIDLMAIQLAFLHRVLTGES